MATGTVYLVGAGPGDPDLLALKAARILREADIVLHDELVSPEILRLIPASAQLVSIGKRCGKKSTPQEEINRLLIDYARLGLQVVRLKGGDPFIFGRGGEEMESLRLAGISVEVVPGITAALGAAAGIQVPLTHRDVSSTLILVVYMPGHDLAGLQQRLLSSGVLPQTPCAIISSATSEAEQVHLTVVGSLATSPFLAAPRLLVVGEVVRFAEPNRLQQHFSELTFSTASDDVSPRESVE